MATREFTVFDALGTRAWDVPPMPATVADRLRWLHAVVRDFYRRPNGWRALMPTSAVLCYAGGLLMFWYHSVYLHEGGPAISWYAHWLLDSTFAFAALTPVLAVLVPLAALASDRLAGGRAERAPWLYVGITGGLFALVTTPGPIGHDLIVGRGTWVADRVTALVGDPAAPLPPVTNYPPLVSMAQQVMVGLPIYLAGAAVSLLVVRALVARAASRAATDPAAAPAAAPAD